MTITKNEQGEYLLTFKGFKIKVTRVDLFKLRNFLNQNINELDD